MMKYVWAFLVLLFSCASVTTPEEADRVIAETAVSISLGDKILDKLFGEFVQETALIANSLDNNRGKVARHKAAAEKAKGHIEAALEKFADVRETLVDIQPVPMDRQGKVKELLEHIDTRVQRLKDMKISMEVRIKALETM